MGNGNFDYGYFFGWIIDCLWVFFYLFGFGERDSWIEDFKVYLKIIILGFYFLIEKCYGCWVDFNILDVGGGDMCIDDVIYFWCIIGFERKDGWLKIIWKDKMGLDGEIEGIGDSNKFCVRWIKRKRKKFGEKMRSSWRYCGRSWRYKWVNFV